MPGKTLLISTLIIGLLSNAHFSLAQNVKQLHHEALNDPYVPNEWNNNKTSPPYQSKNVVKSGIREISIFTTQVNVNSSGQNIIGDAANEPNIAVDPTDPNNIVIGWRQFDNVISNFRQAGWAYSSDGGQSWTFPGVIEPGIFRSDPVLDYDTAGLFYYNSLTSGFFCQVFISADGGATWDAGTEAGGGDKQWMTIDRTEGTGSGNIYASWTSDYSTCLPGFFTRSTDEGATYEACTEVDGDPWWGMPAVGNNGELYIGGAGNEYENLVVAKSDNAQVPGSVITWNDPVPVYMDGYVNLGYTVNPGGLLGMVSLDVDRSEGEGHDNVYMLASLTPLSGVDYGDVMFVRSTDGGLTWSSPVRINDDPSISYTQWFGTMSVAPNGRIDAIWLDNRDGSGTDSSALYYSYSFDQGNTWSANEKLSELFDPHVGYPNQEKMGDYFDMISDFDGVHLAWANTLNGEQDVYYSRIIPDMNTGISDGLNNSLVSISPNPSSGTINVVKVVKQSLIEIYTVRGESVSSTTASTTNTQLDITSYPAGIYFIKISDPSGNVYINKIVKR